MKHFSTNTLNCFFYLTLFSFAFVSCEIEDPVESSSTPNIETLTDIQGEYLCSGECIQNKDGKKVVVEVKGETDRIKSYPKAKDQLYQVHITAKGFEELELGALSGRTLRTATAEVSDSTYPVIEEYVFNTNEEGAVIGFTKTVRNPSHANFKTCVIYGKKVLEK